MWQSIKKLDLMCLGDLSYIHEPDESRDRAGAEGKYYDIELGETIYYY